MHVASACGASRKSARCVCERLGREIFVCALQENFSPTVERCSLDTEVTEFQRTFRDVSEWRQRRHVTACSHTGATKSHPCTKLHHLTHFWRSNMLGLIARWAHNVLLASMGLLTIALVVWAT